MPTGGRLQGLPARHLAGGLRVAEAATRRARLMGLAGLSTLSADQALLLPRCRSVHTFGMRFAIDVVFVDGGGEVTRIVREVGSGRVVFCRRAQAVVETRAGCADRFLAAGVAGATGA